MKILYLDCYSGISGDMFLGALVDAGLDIALLGRELAKLGLKTFTIKAKKTTRQGISATKLDVVIKKGVLEKERSLKDITSIIERSKLDRDIKDKACAIFKSIAQAESAVHGKSVKDLHFHEVGNTDSIVDVVGSVVALKLLGAQKIYSSYVSVGGGGMIMTKGGRIPLPAPAALCLLKGIPLVSTNTKVELVTPTGAAILANFVDDFMTLPDMVLTDIGYGAGANDTKDRPNCLRVMVGETKESFLHDSVMVLEANIDDMNPVDYEYLTENLFKGGALDVYLTPVQMKKTRPGVLLTVLSRKEDLDKLSAVIFNESTSIGVRYYEAKRKKLERAFKKIRTKYGDIKVKVSSGPGGIRKAIPEYADLKSAAGSKRVSISQVRREVERVIK